MKLFLGLLLIGLVPSGSWSAPIMTGEHGVFTRVTVPVPSDQDWTLDQVGNEYRLTVNSAIDLDVADTFRRIGRDRLSDIQFDAGVLTLSMSCLCRAEVFEYRGKFVVIDIYDGPPREITDTDESLTADYLMALPSIEMGRRVNFALPLAPDTPPIEFSRIEIEKSSAIGVEPSFGGLEVALAKSMTQAADSGILSTSIPASPQLNDQTDLVDQDLSPSLEAIRFDGRESTSAPGFILKGNSVGNLISNEDAVASAGCWPDRFTDVASWYDDGSAFGPTVSRLRSESVDGANQILPAASIELAKAYVYFGFGREAIVALDAATLNSRDRIAIRAMASVLDGLPDPQNVLGSQSECSGSSSLWALLAEPASDGIDVVNVDRVLREFKRLPRNLQSLLGIRLSVALRQMGRTEAAMVALLPVRELEPSSVDLGLVDVDILLRRNDIDQALDLLHEIVERDSKFSHEPLIKLAENLISQNRQVPVDVVRRLESASFESRSLPISQYFRDLIVRSYLQNNEFNLAVELGRSSFSKSGTDGGGLWSEVVADIVGRAPDSTFLNLVFSADSLNVGPTVQNDLARRLLDYGFAERALEALKNSATGGAMEERRYLRAEAAMMLGDSQSANWHLLGIRTPRALALLGNDLKPDESADPASKQDAAFRNANWTGLAESDDPLLRSAANLATRPPLIGNPDTPLSTGRAMIVDSADARKTVQKLLDRFSVLND